MGKTYKDKKEYNNIKLGKKMKESAKQKRKTLKLETNPKILKRMSANEWDFN